MAYLQKSGLCLSGRALGATVLMCAAASTASAQWTVTNLHPAGMFGSVANGVGSGQQVGYAQEPTLGNPRASLWSGTAASWVNLAPGGTGYSLAYGADGGQQVGEYYPNGFPRAALWSGTAASLVDLTPAGKSQSSARAVSGGQQVGAADGHAGLWSGSAVSWVDLNPPPNPVTGYSHSSEAYGAGGGQQVGYVVADGGIISASIWSGTAASWVNLHPAGADISQAFGTDGVQQVGIARILQTTVVAASLWNGTAASWVNLNPPGVTTGRANAVHGGQQVGRATVSGVSRASLWSGTAATWVDLHSFLPAGFTSSEAGGIWHAGAFTYVVGSGYNGTTGHTEALLWTGPAPCPADYNHDGFVDGIDYDMFNNDFENPNPVQQMRADYNHDGFVDGIDYDMFNNDFETPCP